jgi:hypothetical protein
MLLKHLGGMLLGLCTRRGEIMTPNPLDIRWIRFKKVRKNGKHILEIGKLLF